MSRIRLPLLVLGLLLTACSDSFSTQPFPTPTGGSGAPQTPEPDVKFWEDNAAVYWNGVARALVAKTNSNAFQGIRGYAVVSVAQYNAAIAAEKEKDRAVHPSIRAAIGSASVVALSYLYPGEAQSLESLLDAFLAAESSPESPNQDPVTGENIGREVASAVVERAKSDRFFDPWTGTIPTGPGYWYSATPPTGAGFGQAKTYFLLSGNQFRPAPPPAFGSPAFNAALAEVRHFSDTRTQAQDASAKFWNLPPGTYTPSGYWNDEASTLAVKYHLNERKTAHLMALMNMVSFDAVVASHEAKYFYWLLRPSQADAAITLPIGLPNFPSYPSNHAAISAGMARVLGATFPAEKARLDALALDAALSRIVGGIHYRFDGDAGVQLGRRVAAWALERDAKGHRPFALE